MARPARRRAARRRRRRRVPAPAVLHGAASRPRPATRRASGTRSWLHKIASRAAGVYAARSMATEPDAPGGAPLETQVDLLVPGGEVLHLTGDAADASIVGSIASHGGNYEPSLLRALSTLVTADSVCVDVGANIGPVTLALSRLCPAGEVHAFEPTPESFRFLQHNVTANAASNVTLHQLALSDRPGEATIHYNREAAGAALIFDRLVDGVPQVVPLATLDAWAASSGLGRLDLVKIDVEGSELQVLDGAAKTI